MYYSISCLLYVLNKISPGHSLKQKIKNLLKENEFVDMEEMGFPKEREVEAIWK